MKTGLSLQDMAKELDRQQNAKRDLLVDSKAIAMDIVDDRPALKLLRQVEPAGILGVNDIAHRQIGGHLKIPATYYDRMRNENPELLTYNVNRWLEQDKSRHMLRTLDGTARAFLSDRYRRIDNYEVASAVLPIIRDMTDARVESCQLTDSNMYIKVVNPRITAEVKKGDIVQAGILVKNSETGQGSVNVTPLIFRLVCLNGMVAQDGGIRKYHIGRVNESYGDGNLDIFRDETIQADDKAFIMKLEDAVRAAVDQAQFAKIVDKMREATEAKLEAATVPKVIELTAKEYSINDDEGRGILGHLIDGGDLSLYGLANAVTRHAQDVESYDRSTELEATGYRIMTMAPALFKRLTADARKA